MAIAPDGGSERLRRVINKGITREDVLQAATRLVQAGIVNLKLYFMIGLPTESEEDLAEMLVADQRSSGNHDRSRAAARGRLANSDPQYQPLGAQALDASAVSSLCRAPLLKKKLTYLRQDWPGSTMSRIMGEKPANAFLQAILARGDRRLAPALVGICPASGGNWQQVFRRHGVDPGEYALRARERGTSFALGNY